MPSNRQHLKKNERFNFAISLICAMICLTSQGSHHQTDNGGVTKVEYRACEAVDIKFREIVQDRIQEDVKATCTSGEEGTPRPVVIFVAQMKVAHQNGDLGASQQQAAKDKEQESNAVVNAVEPDTVHDKVEINENSTKWENATDQNRRNGMQIERLIWDLSRDLVGTNRLFNARLAESKVQANGDEMIV